MHAGSKTTYTEGTLEKIKPLLPRVGKRSLEQPEVLQAFQDLFPEKSIKRIQVCKGSDRTLPPPPDLMAQEAPFRKAIIISRIDEGVKVEKDWEMWKDLSQRQTIRPAHPARVNITMFAAEPSAERLLSPSPQPDDQDSSQTQSPKANAIGPQDDQMSGIDTNNDPASGLKPSAAIDAASSWKHVHVPVPRGKSIYHQDTSKPGSPKQGKTWGSASTTGV